MVLTTQIDFSDKRRGDVWLYRPSASTDEGTPTNCLQGARPVIILSKNNHNRATDWVTVVPCTSNLARATRPFAVFLHQGEGDLKTDGVALCDNVRPVKSSELEHWVGTVPEHVATRLAATVALYLGLEPAAPEEY